MLGYISEISNITYLKYEFFRFYALLTTTYTLNLGFLLSKKKYLIVLCVQLTP